MMNTLSVLDIPYDIYYSISEYLSVVEYCNLSQTSSNLRNFFHPLLYKQCRLFSKTENKTCSLCEWVIPVEVFYFPSNYSWFNNNALKVLIINESLDLKRLATDISLKSFPNLKSIVMNSSLLASTYPNLVAVDCKPNLLSNRIFTDQTIVVLPNFSIAIEQDQNISQVEILWSRNTRSNWVGRFNGFVFNTHCVGIKSVITSLSLKLIGAKRAEDSHDLSYALLDINCYPNLKNVEILSDEYFPLETFEKVITLLPECVKLSKLKIVHSANRHLQHLQLLDNLSGHWNTFSFALECKYSPFRIKLKLPSVTSFDATKVETPNLTFELGKDVKTAFFSFSHSDFYILDSDHSQNQLENLTKLFVNFSPIHKVLKDSANHSIFKRQFPNLKVLDLGHRSLETHTSLESFSLYHFGMILETAPFGDLDLLNFEKIEPLVTQMADMCLNNYRLSNYPNGANKVYTIVEDLKKSIGKGDIINTLRNFYSLQFISGPDYRRVSLQEFYINSRTCTSLTFLRIFKYLPNLERLSLPTLSCIEEYPTLQHLVIHHKKLKSVHVHSIQFPVIRAPEVNDDRYNKMRSHLQFFSYKEDRHKGVEGYLTPEICQNNTSMILDTEAIRQNFHLQDDFLQLMKPNNDTSSLYTFKHFDFNYRYRLSKRSIISEDPYFLATLWELYI